MTYYGQLIWKLLVPVFIKNFIDNLYKFDMEVIDIYTEHSWSCLPVLCGASPFPGSTPDIRGWTSS